MWARRRTLDDGSRAWLFRVVHPNHTITNGKEFMRIKDVNQTPLRDLQRGQPWDFDPTSTEFRRRMKKMHRRVQQHRRAALEPDVQLHVQHWVTKEQFEGTDEFQDHWVHLSGLDDDWDVTPSDWWVGDVLYENRPFQMKYPELPICLANSRENTE